MEGYSPPADVVAEVERIVAAAGIDIGGIEYLIDDRTGDRVYYDINALSNFVADSKRVVGFDAFARLVDWLVAEAESADRRSDAVLRHAGNGVALEGKVA